ncbi:MAG: hypothetical protein MUE49_14075 [Rhodospirillales bacterium]|nr:hypothetical protein [Rhodospirillales bacterium]
MRVIREIEVAGRAVQVRELTVGEIRAWLKDASAPGGDLIDAALFDEFSIPDLCRMTDLKVGEIDALLPSEIRTIAAVAQEVNADFFAMRGRLATLGRSVMSAPSPPP